MTVTESKFYGHEKYVRKRAEEAVGELNETCEPAKKRYTLRAVRNEVRSRSRQLTCGSATILSLLSLSLSLSLSLTFSNFS